MYLQCHKKHAPTAERTNKGFGLERYAVLCQSVLDILEMIVFPQSPKGHIFHVEVGQKALQET
jgi:hypothetical protein